MIAALPSWSDQWWPPRFDGQDVTNSTLQRAFASHPPLKAWMHKVLSVQRSTPKWASVDDMLAEYVRLTTRALFLNDVLAIDMDDQLRSHLHDDSDLWWDPAGRDATRKSLQELKANRIEMDPSGGMNVTVKEHMITAARVNRAAAAAAARRAVEAAPAARSRE